MVAVPWHTGRMFRLPAIIVVASTVLVAALWVTVVEQVRYERDQAIAEATARQANQASAFEEYSIRTIDTAGTLAQYVARDWLRSGAQLDLPAMLRDLNIEQDTFDAVSVVDHTGTVVAAAADQMPTPPIVIADREHFTIHRDNPDVGLFIGKPVMSRRTQTMMVPLTRRLNTADGGFAGIVSVQVPPVRFTDFSSAATVSPRDVFSLVGLDGITRARRVGERHTTGEDIGDSGLFTTRADTATGTHIGPGRLDGIERLYAYRTTRHYPLIATVGVAMDDILAGSRSRRTVYYSSAAVATLGIAAFAGFLVVAITRRRQIFDTLLASRTRLQALFDHSNDAILLVGDTTRVLEVNPAACALLGAVRDELVGTRLADLVPADARPDFTDYWQRFLATGRSAGAMRVLHREGRILDVDYTAVAHIEPGIHLAVFRDITARKLQEHHALRTQRMESLGTLAGGIAHDLNNALAPILMAVAVLREDETDPMKQEMLDTVNASAQRGADMVRQVLTFARGIEGRRVSVAVDQVIRDVERIVNDTFFKTITVHVRIAKDLPPIVGDPTQVHQVLLNLCLNARDAMPNGGTLTITAQPKVVDAQFASMDSEATLGGYVVLGVADTGAGMPADVLDRIFEPFFTTKAVGEGTGLGLSTSLAIVRGHGGFMRVRSEPGRGTAFTVYLPLQEGLEPPPQIACEDAPTPRGHNELVLVIDDEPSVRTVTRQTLEAFGYRVIVASDGTSGVAAYASHMADVALVITDMMMPGLDGAQTIVALRAITPDLRIIAATGLADDARVARALEAGAQQVLPKPFTAERLLCAVREVLSG